MINTIPRRPSTDKKKKKLTKTSTEPDSNYSKLKEKRKKEETKQNRSFIKKIMVVLLNYLINY